MRSSVVAAACFVRRVPLFFGASPRTPLRVLGIIALDTLHVLRHRQPLPHQRVRDLAAFIDFQGCANAAWDHKHPCQAEEQVLRCRLERSCLGTCVEHYLDRLGELESRRPHVGGEDRSFDAARCYREAVAHLAVATAAAIALNGECHAEDISGARPDENVETLFRILMQCQIIDDVLDYPDDLAARLPSFLTGSASLHDAVEQTTTAARSYAASSHDPARKAVLPLRVALSLVTAAARLVLRAARPRRLTYISRPAH